MLLDLLEVTPIAAVSFATRILCPFGKKRRPERSTGATRTIVVAETVN